MWRKPKAPILRKGHLLARRLIWTCTTHEGAGTITRDSAFLRTDASLNVDYSWVPQGIRLNRTSGARITAGNHSIYNSPAELTMIICASIDTPAQALNGGFCNGTIYDNPANYQYVIAFNNGIEGIISTAGGLGTILAGTIPDSAFHTWALTYDGTMKILYLDGAVEDSVNEPTAIGGGGNLGIGSRPGAGSHPLGGIIRYAYLYDRGLTAAEVRSITANPYQIFRRSSQLVVATIPTPGITTIQLDWTDTSEHEDGFSIERKTDAGAFGEIDTVAAGVETYDNVNVPEGHTYTYRVKATDAVLGNSEYSNEAAETV